LHLLFLMFMAFEECMHANSGGAAACSVGGRGIAEMVLWIFNLFAFFCNRLLLVHSSAPNTLTYQLPTVSSKALRAVGSVSLYAPNAPNSTQKTHTYRAPTATPTCQEEVRRSSTHSGTSSSSRKPTLTLLHLLPQVSTTP
jgi:hypothetical protein